MVISSYDDTVESGAVCKMPNSTEGPPSINRPIDPENAMANPTGVPIASRAKSKPRTRIGVIGNPRLFKCVCFPDTGNRWQRIEVATGQQAQDVTDELQRKPQRQDTAAEWHKRRG
jgi:hypothetical protein